MRTVRRRLKHGELAGRQVATPQGFVWRIRLDDVDRAAGRLDGGQSDSPGALAEALRLIRDQQNQLVQLAGQVGYLQSQLQQRDEQLRALEAPKDAYAPESDAGPILTAQGAQTPDFRRQAPRNGAPGGASGASDRRYGCGPMYSTYTAPAARSTRYQRR
jgi:hypothetical protein